VRAGNAAAVGFGAPVWSPEACETGLVAAASVDVSRPMPVPAMLGPGRALAFVEASPVAPSKAGHPNH